MISLLTKLAAFFLKLVGSLDADSNSSIDFFELLAKPGIPALSEKLGRFGWPFIVALLVAVIVLVLVMVGIRRYEVGIAATVLIAVGAGYLAGHGVLVIAFIISVPLAIIIRNNSHTVSN